MINLKDNHVEHISEYFDDKSALWDMQYENGEWDLLKSPLEEPRLSSLVELTEEYCGGAKILDVGCGEGLLLPRISPNYNFFLGIDISYVAISRASILKNERTFFAVADMETFVPSGTFDLIIFNESVYYSADPIAVIKRYFNFLSRNGVIANSISGNGSNIELAQQIEKGFSCLKTKISRNERGAWCCQIIKRKRRSFLDRVFFEE